MKLLICAEYALSASYVILNFSWLKPPCCFALKLWEYVGTQRVCISKQAGRTWNASSVA